MTANSDRVSAQIFQFPARGRFAAAGHADEKSGADPLAPRVPRIAMGSGWYHDQAIQDAERESER
jgi:hypothetical protein